MRHRYIVGIDEVGRGALAGPVVVAAVMMPRGMVCGAARGTARGRSGKERLGKLRDSKKLSPARREAWAEYFAAHPKLCWAVARVYPRTIERRNISGAANLAAHRALARLMEKTRAGAGAAGARSQSPPSSHSLLSNGVAIFLDGGLFIKSRAFQRAIGGAAVHTVVRADETITAVTIASIVAKVHRDSLMRRLGARYPAYGFEVHKGYGTAAHMRAIKKNGPVAAHRLTFLNPAHTMK